MQAGQCLPCPGLALPGGPRPPPHVSSPGPGPRELNTQGPGTSLGHTASCPLASADRQRRNTGGPGIKSDPQRDRRVVSIPIGFETTAIPCPRLPSRPRLPNSQGKGPTFLQDSESAHQQAPVRPIARPLLISAPACALTCLHARVCRSLHTHLSLHTCVCLSSCVYPGALTSSCTRVCHLSTRERMLSHPGLWLSYVLVIAPTGHALTLVCLAHAPHEPPGCSSTPTACESLLSPGSTPSRRASDPMRTPRSLERVGELSPSPHSGAEATSCGSAAIWGTWRSGLGAGYSASCPGDETHPSQPHLSALMQEHG